METSEPLYIKLLKFTRLSLHDREIIKRVSEERVRKVGSRSDIVREGERPRFLNLILSGWACRYKVLEDGRRQIVAFFLPGDLCDPNIFVVEEMDHSIASITPVVISEISRERFDELMGAHPRVTQALWWDALVAASTQREWTLNVGRRTAPERLAHLLCELFIRLQMVGLTTERSCALPLTQTDLADATSLSTVHVNRTLQDLRAAGLVTVRDRMLTIENMQGLRQTAMFNDNYLHLTGDGRHFDANN